MTGFLRFLALLVWVQPACAAPVLTSDYAWQSDDPRLGGVSGIAVYDGGAVFTAITDRGMFVTGTFIRENNAISAITDVIFSPMQNTDGTPLTAPDSEGLARAPDGHLHVSFEGEHGLRSYPTPQSAGSPFVTSSAFVDFQENASLEALAIAPDGALYTLPERSGHQQRPFQVYRYQQGVWTAPFTIPRRDKFQVTGADIGPDGQFYILERDFTGFGFRSRIRRFDLTGGSEEILLETHTRTHDNLEGISVWQDAGTLVITLVADDNFLSLQRTEIVEYRLNH